jgi:REP element-mobilizing transposase RayT
MERYINGFRKRSRHLPHWEDPGATYFITFTLRKPAQVDLTQPRIARLIVNALRFLDGDRYLLYDYTVMPDHVHAIIQPMAEGSSAESLSRITHSLKSWLAHKINELCGRRGPLWQDETYDHIIRNQADYQETAAYILDNAPRKGLVEQATDWPWWGKGSGM